jgi:hypothetical protein
MPKGASARLNITDPLGACIRRAAMPSPTVTIVGGHIVYLGDAALATPLERFSGGGR